MSRARALSVAVIFAIGTGIAWAQQTVTTDSDPSVNFSAFKTYYWAKTNPMPGNDIVGSRIMAAVDAGMASRGWMKAPEGQADLAVVANVSTMPQQKVETFYDGWGGWGYGGWGGYQTVVKSYLEGTLVVDLFDAKTKKLVWRGVATDTVSRKPEKNAEHIDKAVQKMFGKKFLSGVE